jgi:hypothetical protein
VSWCPGEVFSCLADLITILLDDVRVVPAFSSKTERNEQIVQINQRGRRNPGDADLHPDADGRVQHPCRNDRNYTGRGLDMDDVTRCPSFTVMPPDTAPIKRMPSVMGNRGKKVGQPAFFACPGSNRSDSVRMCRRHPPSPI